MKVIPHRELRNNSSAVLRAVESGETFEITNHGKVVAVLIPPAAASMLTARIRPATIRGRFSELVPFESDETSQEILDDLRGER
jgi:prevent-host-death family protein